MVFTAKPSGVSALSLTYLGAPRSALAGESAASVSVTPSAFTAEMRVLAGLAAASGYTGVHAHTSQKWLRNEPPKAPMKKLSASVYCWASLSSGRGEPCIETLEK